MDPPPLAGIHNRDTIAGIGQLARQATITNTQRRKTVKRKPQISAAHEEEKLNTGFFKVLKDWWLFDCERHLFLAVWILSNAALFFFNFMAYFTIPYLSSHRRDLGVTIVIARAGGACLNINCGLILLPVCRNLISMLRSSMLGRFIPFGGNVDFHKLIGWTIVWWSAVHTLAHYLNYMRLAMARPDTGTAPYFALVSGPGYTGHIICVCLFLMVTAAMKPVRRTHFEFFWYTHHLFIFFFGALLIHGAYCFFKLDPDAPSVCIPARAWQYSLGSLVLYLGERVYREINARRLTYISKVVLHPSGVIELQIVKPSCKSRPGQYIFVCIPDIGRYQYHPLTLTSTPELPYISVHIRVNGDWTRRLAKRLGCDVQRSKGVNIMQEKNTLTMPTIMVDGPFGSASVEFCDYEVAVLVGAGIGVTPFASILKSIWYRVVNNDPTLILKKVYFFWICRDKTAFEWFHELLAALEKEDIENFLEIHSYLTGSLKKEEVANVMLNDEEGVRDGLTGLRSPTFFGRPNFDDIFRSFSKVHVATDVGVFFCGPKVLGKKLKQCCSQYTTPGPSGTKFFFGQGIFFDISESIYILELIVGVENF